MVFFLCICQAFDAHPFSRLSTADRPSSFPLLALAKRKKILSPKSNFSVGLLFNVRMFPVYISRPRTAVGTSFLSKKAVRIEKKSKREYFDILFSKQCQQNVKRYTLEKGEGKSWNVLMTSKRGPNDYIKQKKFLLCF